MQKPKQIDNLGFIRPYDGEIDISMTFSQGRLTTSYKLLKTLFGQPGDGDGYKVDAQWTVQTPAGPATIYNYKDGIKYLGRREGTPKTNIIDWHIGGHNVHAYAWVSFAILRS